MALIGVTSLEMLKWVEACIRDKTILERCIWEGVKGKDQEGDEKQLYLMHSDATLGDGLKGMICMKQVAMEARGNRRISGTCII